MIKLAFPNNIVYKPLFENCELYCKSNDISYYALSEVECSNLLLGNLVDAAFINPLGYGKAVKIADYRIIPGPVLFAEDYTGLATIFFRRSIENIHSLISPTPDDFAMVIAKLILSEKFGISGDIVKHIGNKSELLEKSDSAILWGSATVNDVSLDISEEWFDLVELPLPLGFWACRSENCPPKIFDIVNSLKKDNLPEFNEILEEVQSRNEIPRRKGKIYWHWNPELEEALESTLLFLYYHQILSDIPAVKILEIQ
ncbi:MAG: hypothetical protein N2517_06485 [Ignavibacteria bacterium]|nr:hypothetical protein [Ignavibacteria bacterium]